MQVGNAQETLARIVESNNKPGNDWVQNIQREGPTFISPEVGYQRSSVERVQVVLDSKEMKGVLDELLKLTPDERGKVLEAMAEQIEKRQLSLSVGPEDLGVLRRFAKTVGLHDVARRLEDAVPIWAGHHVAKLREDLNGKAAAQLYYIDAEVLFERRPIDAKAAEKLAYFIEAAGGMPAPHLGHDRDIPHHVVLPMRDGRWRDNAVGLLHGLKNLLAEVALFSSEADAAARARLEEVVYNFGITELKGAFGPPNFRWAYGQQA
jgi:hypothetical protein